ncbi:sulfate ABC transporter ATP-binding protein [Ligilactobacillus pabuli]|uniref:Sulfate ABC transporter ATP-binding protein n=1 Tax=Ligilactobacillus pabuli TaxID=2886039 RepID=A0ABQ5JM49_9LACO|nr:ABC transporter ATP-binding protein/permease [Ligilactobacillus pabuli]GKS82000.1 sulfate ABC transporter ATP-binding protein [Ligilactobacillus pabuli]HIW88700.1 ABC transporter ATP-binding protein/permease [Candidatus Ligilactobacillus excrementipullorum]
MLDLKNIKKYYTVGDTTTKALDDVSISFREKEFVSILGASGSGKTTMLNMIGGLDRYDSGDLVINGQSTKTFKDSDWDAYRNNSVGFIFQNYNIITHLSIIDNVTMGMTLSGVGSEEKITKAKEALVRVGLEKHMNKKPAQLSGGQLQRVAIARALANDPEILLADEPTGALDTETSHEIMDLIKELAKDRLVIMVTHNPELAEEYSDRIIRFNDGVVLDDSDPYQSGEVNEDFELKRTKMSFWTALKLSFTNIKTKKGRTFLTMFASSIGIIGIGIVLALSNGFQKQIDSTQSETLSQFPVTISRVGLDSQAAMQSQASGKNNFAKGQSVTAKKSAAESAQHINKLDQKYVDYVQDIKKSAAKDLAFSYTTGFNLVRQVDGKYQPVTFSNQDQSQAQGQMGDPSAVVGVGGAVYPTDRQGKMSFLHRNYQVLAGKYPQKKTDLILIADQHNNVNLNALKNLGFDVKNDQNLKASKLIGTKVKLVANDDFYQKLPTGTFVPARDYAQMANSSRAKTLTVTGILRTKSKNSDGLLANGVAYNDRLTKEVVDQNKNSAIATAQRASQQNVLTGQPIKAGTQPDLMAYLGAASVPSTIQIYPKSFKEKDQVTDYLDKYNHGKSADDKIVYNDLAGNISSLTGGLMDAITYVLIGFAAISLVTSMIMIAIITYTSVLERTKEIGVLKALGARKKDITRVFDAETTILGVGSGILGVLIAWLITFPANVVLEKVTDLSNVAQLNPWHAVLLIIISTILTVLGGHVPARMGSKKDAAIALRSE